MRINQVLYLSKQNNAREALFYIMEEWQADERQKPKYTDKKHLQHKIILIRHQMTQNKSRIGSALSCALDRYPAQNTSGFSHQDSCIINTQSHNFNDNEKIPGSGYPSPHQNLVFVGLFLISHQVFLKSIWLFQLNPVDKVS